MFGFSGNLLAGQHDTKKKRPAPSKPIPVTFPALQPPAPSVAILPSAWTATEEPGISEPFLRLKKPSDVTEDTLALLNVTIEPQCDFETLLSCVSNDAQSHLPPQDWLESPEHIDMLMSSASTATLSNGRKVPDHNDFYTRARELIFPNSAAFATLTRKREDGKLPLRLAHFRKFWEGLDNMAYYWDNTLDEYFPSKDTDGGSVSTDHIGQGPLRETNSGRVSNIGPASPSEEKPCKKAKTEAVSNGPGASPANANGFRSSIVAPFAPSGSLNRALPARSAPPPIPQFTSPNKQLASPNGTYRGYRIGNGAEMPDQYRIDCVRAFVEPIAWAFGVTLSQHRRPPVLKLQHVRFPVRMSSVAWRGHKDRAKARQGWMEGPVLGIQCRADINFGSSGNLVAESALDTVRELGGLLLLAQERAREGKVEERSGEGKWWTTKERWGGGPGGEVGDAQGASDTLIKKEDSQSKDTTVQRNPDGSKARRRLTPAEIWATLKPGHALWDPKIVYEGIGKDRSAECDDVFMVSSLNHHISILRLRIHPLYLDFITEGKLPTEASSLPEWCSPQLQRTRWFDLFDVADRTEAMRGIWGIMSYLMRK